MSTSLNNHSAPEHIEFELTPEQTEVLLRTAPGGQSALELEPLPIEVLTDGELLWLSESQVTPPARETIALESDATPIPTSQERSPGSHEQSTRPLRSRLKRFATQQFFQRQQPLCVHQLQQSQFKMEALLALVSQLAVGA